MGQFKQILIFGSIAIILIGTGLIIYKLHKSQLEYWNEKQKEPTKPTTPAKKEPETTGTPTTITPETPTETNKEPEQLKTTITLGTPPYLTIKEYVDMWDKIKEFNKRNKKMPDPVDTPKGKVTHKDYTAMYDLLKKWQKTHKGKPDMIGPYK